MVFALTAIIEISHMVDILNTIYSIMQFSNYSIFKLGAGLVSLFYILNCFSCNDSFGKADFKEH